MNKVLVVAVHPDDETLGCGGTLLKHKSQGDNIHWLICTTMDKDDEYFEKRENEIDIVSQMYDFDSVHRLHFIAKHLDEYSYSELIQRISDVFFEIRPNIIYLPFKGDIHTDHKKVFDATISCTKSFRAPFVKKLFMMETISETDFSIGLKDSVFSPNAYFDISRYLEKKIEIMRVYQSELSEHPFPRSEKNIRALATFRGAMCGCEYAESFMILREIDI